LTAQELLLPFTDKPFPEDPDGDAALALHAIIRQSGRKASCGSPCLDLDCQADNMSYEKKQLPCA